MDNFRTAMAEKPDIPSEAEELEGFISDLESVGAVREIAGWESGYPGLTRCLNGLSSGLYILIGPPACGKTSFVKQLCDQVALHNSVTVLFFTFSERKNDLRILTLARLSGLENREIRRGSSFVLYRYGLPKPRFSEADEMPPSWEKLRTAAREAKSWLDRVYIVEASDNENFQQITDCIRRIQELKRAQELLVIVDDSPRLAASHSSFDDRMILIAEQLQGIAKDHRIAIVATWPDLRKKAATAGVSAWEWGERIATADALLVMENDAERTKALIEPNRAVNLYVVKNRGGEKGMVAFDFFPAVAKFVEAASGPSL